jgi:DNA invertase Pin-like site-specific DNA recombinase
MRTAIYCRVSTPGQKNTTSLPEQERINREHTASLGWEVSEPHVYHEVEGGEDLYRPCMDRLWDAIQAREIDAVVIDVLDRLSRDEGDQGAVYHHADRYGVTIELASQDYDETEQGRTMRFIAGLHARMEHADIRRRTQRGRKARVASGKMLTPPWPLYGYLWGDPKKGERTYYIIDPETGPVVVLIFDWAANGMSIHEIARRLEADGIPTPSQVLAARGQLPTGRAVSAVWHRSTLQRMLRHPAYWGEHCAYRFAHTKEKRCGRLRRVSLGRCIASWSATQMIPSGWPCRLASARRSSHANWQHVCVRAFARTRSRMPAAIVTLWRHSGAGWASAGTAARSSTPIWEVTAGATTAAHTA